MAIKNIYMLSDIISLYELLDRKLADASILKALFSSNGNRTWGDENILVRMSGDPMTAKIWFYEIAPYKDYIFVPLPINPSVNVDFGKAPDENVPNSKFFRYVSSPMAKFTSGGEENVKVDFMVFGYKAEDLLNIGANKRA